MATLADFKNSFEQDPNRAFFNCAGVSPIPIQAKNEIENLSNQLYKDSTGNIVRLISEYKTRIKEIVAALIGCKSSEVAFFHTCASAISQIAFGGFLKAGDHVLGWDQEYASNAYPWREARDRFGIVYERVFSCGKEETDSIKKYEINTDIIINKINSKTRMVSVSWVQYQSGEITDLAKLADACEELGKKYGHKIVLAVDAIQGLGVMPFNMKELKVDIVFGASHKWNCGPLGLGYMAISEELIPKFTPMYVGSNSYLTSDDKYSDTQAIKSNVERFETGAPFLIPAYGTAASIELILSTGIEVIWKEALRISNLLADGLLSRGYKLACRPEDAKRSPILTFQTTNHKSLAILLKEKGIACAGDRADGVRLAPHAFSTDRSVDRFFQALDECQRK